MKNGMGRWRQEGDRAPIRAGPTPRPRELDEFHIFYERWSSRISAFCLLVCGDQEKAELLTEQTFNLYFRFADLVALHTCSHVPVALLRFASDLAETHCPQRLPAGSRGHAPDLLALPFKERAALILVSILRVQPSVAAVALRLRSSQLAACWTRAALRLRWFGLGTGQPQETAQRVA